MPTQNFQMKYFFSPNLAMIITILCQLPKRQGRQPKPIFYHSYGSNGTVFYPHTNLDTVVNVQVLNSTDKFSVTSTFNVHLNSIF